MDLFQISILSGTLIIGLILQLYPFLKYHYPGGNDLFYHLKRISNPQNDLGVEAYPYLFHYIYGALYRKMKRFSDYTILKISPVINLIPALFFIILSEYLYGDVITAYVFPLVFLSPILIYQSHTFSPRILSIWFYVFAVLLNFLSFPYCYLSAVFVALIALSHRMSMQVEFFTSIVLGIFYPIVAINFLIGFILAVIFSKGYYLTILRKHLSFISNYIHGTHFPNHELKGLIIAPTTFVALFCVLVIFANIFGVSIIPLLLSVQVQFFLIWSLVPISLVFFWRIGDSFRHSAYAVVPSTFLLVYLMPVHIFFYWTYWGILIFSIILSIRYSIRVEHLDSEVENLLNYLSELNKNAILCTDRKIRRKSNYFLDSWVVPYDFKKFNVDDFQNCIQKNKIEYVLIPHKLSVDLKGFKVVKESKRWVLMVREKNNKNE